MRQPLNLIEANDRHNTAGSNFLPKVANAPTRATGPYKPHVHSICRYCGAVLLICPRRKVRHCPALKVDFDRANDVVSRYQVHTTRQVFDYIDAAVLRPIFFVAVAQGNDARPPASAMLATAQRPHAVKELMVRIRLPMRRLSSTGNHHARAVHRRAGLGLDRRCQMHQQRHRAKDALGVIDEPDQLPQVGLAAQIDDITKRRVHMLGFPDLNEEDWPRK